MTSTVETGIEELTGEQLRDNPRCEVQALHIWQFMKLGAFRRGEFNGSACGAPAKYRMRVHCTACGARYYLFMCRIDALYFRAGWQTMCRRCPTRRRPVVAES